MTQKMQKAISQHIDKLFDEGKITEADKVNFKELFCKNWDSVVKVMELLKQETGPWVDFAIDIFEYIGTKLHEKVCPIDPALQPGTTDVPPKE